jgi:hypothetical protein
MCKGAHQTHKRSGAQAQEKKLIPQIKKGNKEKFKRQTAVKKSSQGLKRELAVMNLKQRKRSTNEALEIKRIKIKMENYIRINYIIKAVMNLKRS